MPKEQSVLKLAALFGLLLSCIVYWPGLSGPLLLDDAANLAPLQSWLAGDLGWQDVVFNNQSGLLGRPLAMMSFIASASIGGDLVWQLKFGNLLIHLVCGTLVFALLSMLANRQPASTNPSATKRGFWIALVATAVWLLHPMLASTVLYVVQRMAMLSALFMLAAMVAYVHGRIQMERGCVKCGTLWILFAVPVFTVLAALSKENGLLAPLLCAILEWTYFRPARDQKRPIAVRFFILFGVLLPVVAGAFLLWQRADWFLAGYDNRHFSPVERLLTQSRVLFDYVYGLVLPQGQRFSLYRDDYLISTGLLSPWTTLAAVVGWLSIISLAIKLRNKIPGFTAGIGLFLVGHSLESSIFPLLIYFEHRNYLPAVGMIWAITSVVVHISPQLASHIRQPLRLARVSLVLLVMVLATATFARSMVWQSNESLIQQSLEHYPNSRFMRMELANIEMNRVPPNVQSARGHYFHLTTLNRPSTQFIGLLGQVAIDCFIDQATDPVHLNEAFALQLESIEADVLKAIIAVSDIIKARPCQGLPADELATRIVQLVNTSKLSDVSSPIIRLRFRAARLYHHANQNKKALEQAQKAWDTGAAEIPVGMMVVGLRIRLNQPHLAARLLDELTPKVSPTDKQGQSLVNEYRNSLLLQENQNAIRSLNTNGMDG